MFQVYAVIGASLLIIGLIFGYFFVKFLCDNVNALSITSISEALVTIFIGIFYVYCATVLSASKEQTAVLNFTNNIDDIALIETPIDEIEENEMLTPTDKNILTSPEEFATEETVYVTTLTNVDYSTTEEMTTKNPTTIKKDQFLTNYMNFFKDIIHRKDANATVYKSRKKRDTAQDNTPKERRKCLKNVFLNNALLLYSFTHCVLTLLSYVLYCKKCAKCVKEEPDTSDNKSTTETDTEDLSSRPVGPLFEDHEVKKKDDRVTKLFRANIKSQTNLKSEENVTKNHKEVVKLIVYTLMLWTLPIISLTLLYGILISENVYNNETSDTTVGNLSAIQVDPNILNVIQIPSKATNTNEAQEVDRIVKSVYGIVKSVNNTVAKRTPFYTPVMVDVVYFLNGQNRNSEDDEEECLPASTMSLKIFYTVIFLVTYFIVTFYAKITEQTIRYKSKDTHSNTLNKNIMAFSILWLPSIVDLFFRTFLTTASPSILSDIFLALGNGNRLYTMFVNYSEFKKIRHKSSLVEPVV